jgi:putative peptide zinc metalloprotease protein
MTPPLTVEPQDSWLETEPLRLREDVEIITGAGGRPMLVAPGGKFLTVSTSGITLLRRLDSGPTGRNLIEALSFEHPEQVEQISAVVPAFLTGLRQAKVLTIEPAPTSSREKFTRLGKVDPVKRFPLVDNPNRFADPAARLLGRIPAALLCGLVLGIGVLALPLMIVTVVIRPMSVPSLPIILAALGLMVCEIVVHEFAHAVGMAYNRVPAKNAGVGLLFYILPIAYVDRTESYRHRGRFGRALISLVGPLTDMLLAGITSLVVLNATGPVATLAHTLLLLQILSLLANLNPLFPSDGYHALEASLGSINMRGRALTYVLHKVSRTAIPLYLQGISRRTRVGYMVYAVISLLYTALVILAVLGNLLALLARLL